MPGRALHRGPGCRPGCCRRARCARPCRAFVSGLAGLPCWRSPSVTKSSLSRQRRAGSRSARCLTPLGCWRKMTLRPCSAVPLSRARAYGGAGTPGFGTGAGLWRSRGRPSVGAEVRVQRDIEQAALAIAGHAGGAMTAVRAVPSLLTRTREPVRWVISHSPEGSSAKPQGCPGRCAGFAGVGPRLAWSGWSGWRGWGRRRGRRRASAAATTAGSQRHCGEGE